MFYHVLHKCSTMEPTLGTKREAILNRIVKEGLQKKVLFRGPNGASHAKSWKDARNLPRWKEEQRPEAWLGVELGLLTLTVLTGTAWLSGWPLQAEQHSQREESRTQSLLLQRREGPRSGSFKVLTIGQSRITVAHSTRLEFKSLEVPERDLAFTNAHSSSSLPLRPWASVFPPHDRVRRT